MKKRPVITLLTAIMTGVSVSVVPFSTELPSCIVAEAANELTYTFGDYTISYVAGSPTATIKAYTGNSSTITVPGRVNTPNGWKNVTKIGDSAFKNNRELIRISLPEGLTEIGSLAFYNCCELTRVYVPNTVNYVGESAFNSCGNLETIELNGPTIIKDSAFHSCSSLKNIKLHRDCIAENNAFSQCSELYLVNSIKPWTIDNSGKPVLTNNSVVRNLIKNVFENSDQIKFVNEYCKALCDYVVSTETRSWMSEAVKARQLFDWVIDHCEFETDNTTFGDPENQDHSSLFLSYGLSSDGVGESVCNGYAKAYTLLLKTAGIESYVLSADQSEYGKTVIDHEYWGGAGHAWNFVRIGGNYYQCDASVAEFESNRYNCFLKNEKDMDVIHKYYYNLPTISTELFDNGIQSNVEYNKGKEALKSYHLSNNYPIFDDANCDGILDLDFDFNGIVNQTDTVILNKIGSRDVNLDGRLSGADTTLIQYFYSTYGQWVPTNDPWVAFCYSLDHWNWLEFCIDKHIFE